jgi:D-alanyl-D-alanine carboxypeptidase-like protein
MAIYWGRIDTKLLLPSFKEDVELLLSDSPFEWHVTEGFRSMERSNALYAAYDAFKTGRGPPAPRAAPGGRSAHNFGLAVDVALSAHLGTPGSSFDWTPNPGDGWYWLRDAVKAHPRLTSGYSYDDWPHIERFKWENFKYWASPLV